MYEIKVKTLHHKGRRRKRLVIEFTDKKKEILQEFLMTDALLLDGELIQEVEALLRGDRMLVSGSGNRTSWHIDKECAVIDDLFADMGIDLPLFTSTAIETTKLYDIMIAWLQAQEDFSKDNE